MQRLEQIAIKSAMLKLLAQTALAGEENCPNSSSTLPESPSPASCWNNSEETQTLTTQGSAGTRPPRVCSALLHEGVCSQGTDQGRDPRAILRALLQLGPEVKEVLMAPVNDDSIRQ